MDDPVAQPLATCESPVISNAAPGTPTRGFFSLLRLGGMLGAAAVAFEMLLFLIGCFGVAAAFRGPPMVAVVLASAGLFFSLIGGLFRGALDEDTHVLFGLFTGALGLAGALVEMGVGNGWPMFK